MMKGKLKMKTKRPLTMEDKRWSLEEEVHKLIKETLDVSFQGLGELSDTIPCKEEYGDYQCENVLSIWPKLKERGSHMKPVDVGQKIKKHLRKRLDMIQEVPCVHDIGIVTFKLLDEWISRSIHKMLRDGIETWAPKLPVETVIIHTPSIIGNETLDDRIRRTCIGDTLTRMLEYSRVVVSCLGSDSHWVPRQAQEDEWNKCFLIEKRDGYVVICGKAEGEPKPLIRVKQGEGDIAFKDLGALRAGLVNENADWIVCLTPAWRRDYIKMCFTAAEYARWISADRYYGLSYAGYRTRAELRTSFPFDSPELTDEMCFECAIDYTYLKNNRLAECKFNLDEMFHEEGNTVVYLLNTHARIRKITSDSCKDIEKLKRASRLTLDSGEVLAKENGHALGFHLLRFTEVLKQACLSVLPHILCKFLFELSEKFNNYNSSYTSVREVGSVVKTSRLLLCEATLVVMEKCFHLLGITSMLPGNIEGSRARKCPSYLQQLWHVNEQKEHVITPVSVARELPINSRFELIAVSPESSNRFVKGRMFGYIVVSDEYGMRTDGWGPISKPDYGYVSLFGWDWCDAKDMINHGLVYPPNPSSQHTVPLSSSLSIRMELFVETKKKDSFFKLGYQGFNLDLSEFEGENEVDGACHTLILEGTDLIARLYYILLKDAVDTCLEIKFYRDTALGAAPVALQLNASYGHGFPYSKDPIVKGFYKTSLFEANVDAGPIMLRKSALAAPRNGSLIIEARLEEADSGKLIMVGSVSFTFEEAVECITGEGCCGMEVKRIMGKGGYFEVKVNWKYNKA